MSRVGEFFDLAGRGTTVARELRGAAATFLTMAYILFTNPGILKSAGVPFESATACTALAAGVCCILMGLVANFPLALASGMGLNAVLAYQIVLDQHVPWPAAMGLIVLDGLVVLVLVLCGLREAVMNAIPRDLRRAIGAGIGLFIAFIGMVNAKLVIPLKAGPPVTHGPISNPEAAVAVFGLLLTGVLMARRVKGAIVLGILLSTGFAYAWDFATGGRTFLANWPTELKPPSFETLFAADVVGALTPTILPLLLAFLMVDFFDTLGTVTAISDQARLTDEKGRIPRLKQVLIVDSVSASIGGLCGVSSVTSYIESAAGVAEGARTGLHSVFVGLLFLLAIFAAPLAGIVPLAATAPALILVGFLMVGQIARVDFDDLDTAIPAYITLVALPFTYSIAHGIGYGFIAFVVIKVCRLKFEEVHPLMYAVAGAFGVFLVL